MDSHAVRFHARPIHSDLPASDPQQPPLQVSRFGDRLVSRAGAAGTPLVHRADPPSDTDARPLTGGRLVHLLERFVARLAPDAAPGDSQNL